MSPWHVDDRCMCYQHRLSSSDDCCQFIIMNVHLCVQHVHSVLQVRLQQLRLCSGGKLTAN